MGVPLTQRETPADRNLQKPRITLRPQPDDTCFTFFLEDSFIESIKTPHAARVIDLKLGKNQPPGLDCRL